MNKLITILIVATALGAYAERPPSPGAYRHNAEVRQKQNKEQEKTKKKLAQYKTDEGVCGTRVWKEYTANPKGKGEPTLLVVFGGRDSVYLSEGPAPSIPPAIEKALDYARCRAKIGKLIVLVPEMTVARKIGGGRRGLEEPSDDGIAKLVRSRAEAHGVKPTRIIATGFSMGGGLLLSLLNNDPTLFSRALVVGASGKTDAIADIKAEVLSYHGENDDLIPIARVKAYAEALCEKRPHAMKVEVLTKTGHAESEKAAYSKPDVWKWLFR